MCQYVPQDKLSIGTFNAIDRSLKTLRYIQFIYMITPITPTQYKHLRPPL